MKTLSLALSALSLVALAAVAQAAVPKMEAGEYALDASHTKVGFSIPHLVISSVEGRFEKFSGKINVGKKLEDTAFEANIDVGSINTANADRDGHLKGADFFEAEKFPTITFKSTQVSGPADALQVKGNLTIKGVTKPVTLKGKYAGVVNDPFGNTKVAYTLVGAVKRKDFGLNWSKVVEAGPVVGDEVTLEIKLQGAKPIAKK